MACRGPSAGFLACGCSPFLPDHVRGHSCAVALKHLLPWLPNSPSMLVRHLESPEQADCYDSRTQHVGPSAAAPGIVRMAAGESDDDGSCRAIVRRRTRYWASVGGVGQCSGQALVVPADSSVFRSAAGRGADPLVTGFLGEICGKATVAFASSGPA